MESIATTVGQRINTFLETAGEFGLFSARVARDVVRRPFEMHEIEPTIDAFDQEFQAAEVSA